MKEIVDILGKLRARAEEIGAADDFADSVIDTIRTDDDARAEAERMSDTILHTFNGARIEAVIFALATSLGYSAVTMNGNTTMMNVETGDKRVLNTQDFLTSLFIIADKMVRGNMFTTEADDCQCESCVQRRAEEAAKKGEQHDGA